MFRKQKQGNHFRKMFHVFSSKEITELKENGFRNSNTDICRYCTHLQRLIIKNSPKGDFYIAVLQGLSYIGCSEAMNTPCTNQ